MQKTNVKRFILSADWHIRTSKPQYRIDNFGETVLEKITWIVKCANHYKANIIVAGDIFDNIRIGTRTVNRVIRILRKCAHKIYAIAGQHDMENHGDDLLPSPYLTLMEAGVIIDVSGTCVDNVYGIKWEGGLDVDFNKVDKESILVIHHTVTPKEPPFFLTDAISAQEVLKSFSDLKFIVCGDYHSPHTTKQKGRILVNCGSLIRSSKDQYDYKPQVYLLDVEKGGLKTIKVPIKPPEEVFRIPKDTKVEDEKLSEHISKIIELTRADGKPEFISTVKMIMRDEEFSDRQRELALYYYNEVKST